MQRLQKDWNSCGCRSACDGDEPLLQLTKIAGTLARKARRVLQRRRAWSRSWSTKKEETLPRVAPFPGARQLHTRRLRAALTEKPGLLVKAIETAMEEDFDLLRSAPGAGSNREVSTRGWLEARSKLQYYPNTIRFGWILAGVHDAMRQG